MEKRTVKALLWILNILVILLLVYSLVNYKFLEKELVLAAQIGGLGVVAILIFFLEGAPLFVGPSVAVAAILATGTNPWWVLAVFLISAILGSIAYYYIGHILGEKALRYFEKRDIKKYRELFAKYGTSAMVLTAMAPIPYLPTIAGVFKMSKKDMFIKTMGVRLLRHIVVFLFWFFILG
jgi:membrane protein YqaA with SNARE-associated domain